LEGGNWKLEKWNMGIKTNEIRNMKHEKIINIRSLMLNAK
jgi:hypothetical protein